MIVQFQQLANQLDILVCREQNKTWNSQVSKLFSNLTYTGFVESYQRLISNLT